MHIIVAPDSFKGTATAPEAAAGIAAGIREVLPEAKVTTLPLADGGEGTAHIIATALASAGHRIEQVTLPTANARGTLTEATYFMDRDEDTAYIDVAAASGLPAVADNPDPLHSDTYGTGVLIADAESKGMKKIVLGLGGSATVDGGTGILAALGAAPHDERGYALPKGGAPLVALDYIDTAQLNMKAAMLDYVLLADTRCDAANAAIMYGPQKGADKEQVALLTGALLHLCEVTGIDPATESFGAAGAVPVGLTWVSEQLWGTRDHVTIQSGARYVADVLNLPERLAKSDLIITGEGAFDEQSLTGKVVGTVAELASGAGVRLGIVAGQLSDEAPSGALAAELLALRDGEDQPMAEQLRAAGRAIAKQFQAAAPGN